MHGRHRPEPYAPMSHCPQALRVSVERSESPPPHPHRAWWGAVHGATCRAPTATPGAPGPPPDPASHPGQSGGVREEALGLGLQARSWLPHREAAPLARGHLLIDSIPSADGEAAVLEVDLEARSGFGPGLVGGERKDASRMYRSLLSLSLTVAYRIPTRFRRRMTTRPSLLLE